MARRRRKRSGFGSTSATHRQRARSTAAEFRHAIGMARTNLDNGECGRAFIRLKLIYRMHGEFIADRRATSRSSFPRKGGMTRQIEPLSVKFAKFCMR